jgi:protein-S-isoprenylcysteine O-methyltransferase Ste14
MFLGLFLVRSSLAFAVLGIITVLFFHLMVLKEENYLAGVHGNEYLDYKRTTGRYLPRLYKTN